MFSCRKKSDFTSVLKLRGGRITKHKGIAASFAPLMLGASLLVPAMMLGSGGASAQLVLDGGKNDGGSTAMGFQTSTGGYDNTVSGAIAAAYGTDNHVLGDISNAFGVENNVTGIGSSAFGTRNDLIGQNLTAVGFNNEITLVPDARFSALAVGTRNVVEGRNSTAIGLDNEVSVTADNSVVIGVQSKVTNIFTTAIGYQTEANGEYATAIGYLSKADGGGSTAIGDQSVSNGDGSTAIGFVNYSEARDSAAIGNLNHANARASVAIGFNNHVAAGALAGSAVGYNNLNGGLSSYTAGYTNDIGTWDSTNPIAPVFSGVNYEYASAVGVLNKVNANYASAFGYGNQATGVRFLVMGAESEADGEDSIAIGSSAKATMTNSLAIGTGAESFGANAIAIGFGAKAFGSIATGTAAYAGDGGAAYGDGSQAGATIAGGTGALNTTAIGPNARAGVSNAAAHNATALGAGAISEFANATAIGEGTVTDEASQLKLGKDGSVIVNSQGVRDHTGVVGDKIVTVDATGNIESLALADVIGAATIEVTGGGDIVAETFVYDKATQTFKADLNIGDDKVTAAMLNVDTAGAGLGQDGTGALEVGAGNGITVNADTVEVKAANGILVNGNGVNVDTGAGIKIVGNKVQTNVDDITIEVGPSGLQVKDGGITTAKIADGAVTLAKLDPSLTGEGLVANIATGAFDVNAGNGIEVVGDMVQAKAGDTTIIVDASGIKADTAVIAAALADRALEVDAGGQLDVKTDETTITVDAANNLTVLEEGVVTKIINNNTAITNLTEGVVNNIAGDVTNRTTLTNAIVDEGLVVDAGPGIIINASNQVQADVDETSLTINPTTNKIEVKNGGITNVHLGDEVVDSRTIKNYSILNEDLATGAVDSRVIADGSIQEEDLSFKLRNKFDRRFSKLRDGINEGVALAAALQAPYVERDRRFAIRGAVGHYKGAVGIGVSGAFRINSHWAVDAGVSVGTKTASAVTTIGTQLSW